MAGALQFYTQESAQILLMAQQLREHERLAPVERDALQRQQLLTLLVHAWRYSAYWQEKLEKIGFAASSPSLNCFTQLAPLTRKELQAHFVAMRARSPGTKEKDIVVSRSSGSTGTPVSIEKDQRIYAHLYSAISWVDNLWHQRDPRKKIAVIGLGVAESRSETWGSFYSAIGLKGGSYTRDFSQHSLASHLEWLLELSPAYLKTSPSVAAQLAQLARKRQVTLPIEQIISQWERVTPAQRQLCKRVFGADIIDRYSCEEAGWLALQCPSQQLHVVAPSVYIEIVDEAGNPCPVGQVGRVLVTSLHSLAMPLIRYELGDLAQWGAPCSCGMSLPVIGKLWGRTRQQVQLSDGSFMAMAFLGDELGVLPGIEEFRIVQYADKVLELQIAAQHLLKENEREGLQAVFARHGLAELPLHIKQVNRIDWPDGRKREEFVRVEQAFHTNA